MIVQCDYTISPLADDFDIVSAYEWVEEKIGKPELQENVRTDPDVTSSLVLGLSYNTNT